MTHLTGQSEQWFIWCIDNGERECKKFTYYNAMGNESARQSFSVESTMENKNAKQNLSHGYAFRILSFHSLVKTQLSVF